MNNKHKQKVSRNQSDEEKQIKKISIKDFMASCNISAINVKNLNQEIKLSSISVNRPGLFLAGFENYFASSRVQVFGNAEMFFLAEQTKKKRKELLESLFSQKIPCAIVARSIKVDDVFIQAANKYKVPVFISQEITSELINNLTKFLNDLLSENILLNAELIEVNGAGVLIFGESGMGKSETALDLVTRGHRLVADDVVLVKHVKDALIGTAPERIRFLMEIRGMGLIDIRELYGVGSVMYESKIDLAIELIKWSTDTCIERLGDVDDYTNILGVQIPKITIPVVAGRNLAILVEVASRNYKLKKLGFNSLSELLKKQNFEK